MQKIDSGSKVPIKLWIDEIEESALQQARNVASFPFVQPCCNYAGCS
jgi:hypothetical protein